MSGLSRTPGKRVYGASRTEGSNPSLSAISRDAPRGAFPFLTQEFSNAQSCKPREKEIADSVFV